MAHEVVIVFSGMVALGPPLPLVDPTPAPFQEDGPLFGVMPLSGRRRVLVDEPDEMDKPDNPLVERFSRVHLPVIFTNRASTGRPPDENYRGFRIWFPMRERLQVLLDGQDTRGKLTYVHDPLYGTPGHPGDPAVVPAPAPIEDVAAIPDLRFVSPDRSTLLDGTLDPKATNVAAQVFVPSGTLRAGAEDKRKFGTRATYRPNSVTPPPVVVVVPQLRITVEVETKLAIETSSLDTGLPLDPLLFNIDAKAEIWIANLDTKDVRNIIDRLVDSDTADERAVEPCDVDFVRIYDLTEGEGNVIIPCDEPPQAGERKCYTGMVKKGAAG